MTAKPSVFIGSSSESKPLANAIDISLRDDCRCRVWDTGVFALGGSTLPTLMESLPKFDFAIMVFSPDDLAEVRNQKVYLPRDNVLFELGLFMGHSGPGRVFVLHWDDGSTRVPSDLAGVTLARVKSSKPLKECTGEELREEIKPAIEKIRDAFGKASLPVTVHYIAPTSSHSEYYGLLQLQLQTQLETGGMSWRFHPCTGKLPEYIYQQLRKVLETATSRDAVLLVPKGLSAPGLREDFERTIESHKETRIIFLDQQPPDDLLKFEHVSSVGPDNRKVGILAAYALHKRLKGKLSSYWVLGGPGGPSRRKGFMDAMQHFGLGNVTKLWPIHDSDRFANRDEITKFLKKTNSDETIGVFAGNDENAFATVGAAEKLHRENVFVVGCDGSREFRFHMDSPDSPLVATVDTKLKEQAARVLSLLQQPGRRDERLDPELFPYDPDFKTQLQDSSFRSLWNGE